MSFEVHIVDVALTVIMAVIGYLLKANWNGLRREVVSLGSEIRDLRLELKDIIGRVYKTREEVAAIEARQKMEDTGSWRTKKKG